MTDATASVSGAPEASLPRLSQTEREQKLLRYLQARLSCPELRYEGEPRRLLGGSEAAVFAFRLANAPPPFDGPMVVRSMRRNQSPERSAAEAGIHDAARAAGVPVPRCLLHESRREILSGAFLLLELLEGEAVLGGAAIEVLGSGLRTRTLLRSLRGAPQLSESIPSYVAAAALEIAAVDAASVEAAVRARGGSAEFLGLDARLGRVERRIARSHLAEALAPAFEWLVANRPSRPERLCLVHGDLAPTNLLVRDGELVGVLDWAKALLAEPEAEVGFQRASFHTAAISGLGPLNRLARPLLARLAERVTERVAAERPLDPERMRWYQALRSVSVLASIAKRTKPWKKHSRAHVLDARYGSRVAAREIERLTGTRPSLS